MLVLTRRVGETLLIGDAEVTVLQIRGNTIRVGVTADKSVNIRRSELPPRPRDGEAEAAR